MNRTSKATSSPRGRGLGLSREVIVDATLEYLRANPFEYFTVARAGAAAGASPMAIYRHFQDSADLSDAIVAKVLEDIEREIPPEGDWRAQVRAWIEAVYQRMVETPQCVNMLSTSSGLSVAWIRASAPLLRSLEAAGLRGRELSETLFWVAISVAGFTRHMLADPLAAHVEDAADAIARLDPPERASFAEVASFVPDIFSHAREVMVDGTLAYVELVVARHN